MYSVVLKSVDVSDERTTFIFRGTELVWSDAVLIRRKIFCVDCTGRFEIEWPVRVDQFFCLFFFNFFFTAGNLKSCGRCLLFDRNVSGLKTPFSVKFHVAFILPLHRPPRHCPFTELSFRVR